MNRNSKLLHKAAKKGSVSELALYLRGGDDINRRNPTGKTPLFFAAQKNQIAAVKFLLENGQRKSKDFGVVLKDHLKADPEINDDDGNNPFGRACSRGHTEIIKLFLEHGVKPVSFNNHTYGSYNEKTLEIFLEYGVDLKSIDKNGSTVLHSTISDYSTEFIKKLLDYGVDPNIVNHNGDTALIIYIKSLKYNCDSHNIDKLLMMLEAGADPNIVDQQGVSTLGHHLSTVDRWNRDSKLKVASILLENGANPNCIITLTGTPLINYLCSDGHYDLVKELLKYNVDINVIDSRGYTPFYYIIYNKQFYMADLMLQQYNIDFELGTPVIFDLFEQKQLAIIEQILKRGADPNTTSRCGYYTPLCYVIKKFGYLDYSDVVELLLKYGADPNQMVNNTRPIIEATEINNYSMVKLLLDHNADPMVVKSNGYNLLHIAVTNRTTHSENLIKLLLDCGIDVNVVTNDGSIPLHYAAWYSRNTKSVKLLVEAGSKINVFDNSYMTPLDYAIFRNGVVVEYLLENGAKANSLNRYHQSPLNNALFYADVNIIEILLKHGSDPNDLNLVKILYSSKKIDYISDKLNILVKYGMNRYFVKCIMVRHKNHNKLTEFLKSLPVAKLQTMCLQTIYEECLDTTGYPNLLLKWPHELE